MLDPAPLFPETIRPLRRLEYERMVEIGLFEDERIELLRGALVKMSPQKGAHASGTMLLNRLLTVALDGRAFVRPQLSLALSDDSEPEPDIAVVPLGSYRDAHPTTALLIVEVAETSLRKDRTIKAELYAEAGIQDYWILDVVAGTLEVHRAPALGRYTSIACHGRDATVRPLAFPDVAVHVGALLD